MREEQRETPSCVTCAIDALEREARAHEALLHAALQSPLCEVDVVGQTVKVASATSPSMYLQTLGYGVRAAWIYRRTSERLAVHAGTRAHTWSKLVRQLEEDCVAELLLTRPFAQHACIIVGQLLHAEPHGDLG